MTDRTRGDYDTGIGTSERSAVSATKVWAIVLGIIGLIGLVMIITFLGWGNNTSSGPASSENTATRPAEP